MDASTFNQKKESGQRAVSWYKLVWIHFFVLLHTLLGSVYLRVILNLSYTLLGSVYLRVIFNLFYTLLGSVYLRIHF